MGVAHKGVGGCKGLPDWFGDLFFPRLPGGVRACQDGLGHFFPRLPVWQRGWGVKSYLGNFHIELTHFKKGLPLPNQNFELVHQVFWRDPNSIIYPFLPLWINHLLQSIVIETGMIWLIWTLRTISNKNWAFPPKHLPQPYFVQSGQKKSVLSNMVQGCPLSRWAQKNLP